MGKRTQVRATARTAGPVELVLRARVWNVIIGMGMGMLAPTMSGCALFESNTGASAKLTYTENARAAYGEAMTSFRDKDWEDARALFAEVQKLFPHSRYARLAELRIADINFEQEKYTDAVSGYRSFVQNHRTDEDLEYARYQTCRALFRDIDDTVFLPPQEQRDQATTLDAYRELKSFANDKPDPRYVTEIEYMLEVVTSRLVRHELYVARYYIREDSFDAAVDRIDYALTHYPKSGLDPEALVLKGETLLKMHKNEEAKKAFESVIQDHGGPFATTARSFLAELGAKQSHAVR